MSDKISIDELGDQLSKIVEQCTEDIQIQCATAVKQTAEEFNNEIPMETAFDDGNHKKHLRLSFVATPIEDSLTRKVYAIHAVNGKYRIVHLVENGHIQKSSAFGGIGSVPAHHFLLPLTEKYKPILEERVRAIIKNSGN